MRYVKLPSLSTSFSESGKNAKDRFDNILNIKARKTGILEFAMILALVGIIGTMASCNRSNDTYKNENLGFSVQISENIKKLYELKDTNVGDNSKVYDIVSLVDFADLPVQSIVLKTDHKPYAITVNYKVDSRADYRFFDYSSFDKNAVVMFCLIPDADEIHFRIYDNYSSVDVPDTSFASAYYNRQNLSERAGMEYFIDENIINAASSIENFADYFDKVSAVSSQTFYDKESNGNSRLTQIYHVIGDDCEITVNSQLMVFITVTKEIAVNQKLNALLEPKNIHIDEYIGKKIEFSTYNIRNFKTNQSTDYLFVFDGEKLIAYDDLKDMHKDRDVMDVLRMFADGGI